MEVSSRWLRLALAALLLALVGADVARLKARAVHNAVAATHGLISRRLGDKYNEQISLRVLQGEEDDLDVVEVGFVDGKLEIAGNTATAMAYGLQWYMKRVLHTQTDWDNHALQLPDKLPPPPARIRQKRSAKFTYYQNVCTVSYSSWSWSWQQWEAHIDWMALNGINMPLAFTGQEKAWQNTFMGRYNISQKGIDKFFAGAAFLAWGRMGNLRGSWVKGPLPQAFIDDQYKLQRRILARMTEFGMIPALPAFAGHVPEELTKQFPLAKFTRSPNWGSFSDEFCCVYMLDAMDPLYLEIGRAFIEEQKKLYYDVTSTSLYQCDTYNEMDPDFTDLERLRAASGAVIKSMTAADPDAVWLMQGWLFVDAPQYWTKPRVHAYLDGVPDDKLIILDLYSEVRPIWQQMDNYFGKNWIYCVLHNFGGNTGMRGDLPTLAREPVNAVKSSNGTMIGVGLTMEGIFQNYVVYDLALQTAWEHTPVDPTQWIKLYTSQRYNLPTSDFTTSDTIYLREADDVSAVYLAWNHLLHSVYNRTLAFGGVTKNIVSLIPHWHLDRDGFMPTVITYKRKDVIYAWKHLLNAGEKLGQIDTYRHDLVDVTRQYLSDQLLVDYQQLRAMFTSKVVTAEKVCGQTTRMLGIMTDLDTILATNEDFLLGKWIADARNMATNDSTSIELADYYEYEARNQVTRWGDNNSESIHDYAAKEWSGLISDYYIPRWRIWLTEVCQAYSAHRDMDETVVNEARVSFELKWQLSHEKYPTEPRGDPVAVSTRLYAQYIGSGEEWGLSTAVQWE